MELDEHLNGQVIRLLGRSLENVRRSVTAIFRILQFLTNFAKDLDGFAADNLPSQCVQRLVEISFCGRCIHTLPPLCRNSCGALVRGCYAGFLSSLESEFDLLRSVLVKLVREIDLRVREMFDTATDVDVSVIILDSWACEISSLVTVC